MEFIPLITLQKGRITQDISEKLDEFKRIYVLDLDGIEKGRPNFDFYQKFSASVDLWVDNGPRNIGDVVDALMAGATDITIRREMCKNLKISDIRDVSENKIYANIDFEKSDDMFFYEVDGFVNFIEKDRIEPNLEYSGHMDKIKAEKKIYSYESDRKNISFWAGLNIEGLLVDIGKFKEFKNGF